MEIIGQLGDLAKRWYGGAPAEVGDRTPPYSDAEMDKTLLRVDGWMSGWVDGGWVGK